MKAARSWAAALAGSAAALCLAAPAPSAPAPASPAKRPNIVFILLDDAGFSDFGSYGGEIATPNIDQIARAGVRFTNFHTASTCESTRVMLQSGVDHHRAGAGTLQVVIADNQRGQPGYEGYLNDRVHSLGQLMRSGGYATYYSGKWNIGNGLERSPGARGWDRYIALEQTGADNYEAKMYAPLNLEAVWWEDGKRAVLPKDFYSSRTYVDKMISYIEDGRAQGKPFFGMVAFQAVHSPLQAPDADIDKYKDVYQAGWDKIRSARYQRQVEMGLLPAGIALSKAAQSKDWSSLSEADKRLYAKKMAVFAGMLDNADQQVGRLRTYLQKIGQLDNTVFVVMSDNGADPYELNNLNFPFKVWYMANYALGHERAGQPGSYVHYGQDWAQVSNTPFALFKGTSAEGGMRVPFIISTPGMAQGGRIASQFAYVTDFLPTMLDLAGISLPKAADGLLAPTGASMRPYLEGRADSVHGAEHVQGFEGTGGDAVFRGSFKLARNQKPYDDREWHLFDISQDPAESQRIEARYPELVRQMQADFDAYVSANGVVLPQAGYDPIRQLLKNNWPVLLRQIGWLLAAGLAALVVLIVLLFKGWKRLRRVH